jgi:hypothetical protein
MLCGRDAAQYDYQVTTTTERTAFLRRFRAALDYLTPAVVYTAA